MRANGSNNRHTDRESINIINPKPGEIWELARCLPRALVLPNIEQQHVYSEAARMFLEGKSPARYVMVVREPEPLINHLEWQEVSVMVLSGETNFLSNVDILIPKEISGIAQDLLAETWHILPMLTCNLLQPVGQRLSRIIYDVLITIGDCERNLYHKATVAEDIQAVGLRIGAVKAQEQQAILAFHAREEAWSEVLSIPLSPYQSNLTGIKQAEAIFDTALEIELLPPFLRGVGGIDSCL